jgi:hypothetical protein
MRLVAKGAFVLMAVAVVAAALSRGQRSQATVLERKILIQQLLEDPVSTTPPPSTPAPATRIIGPSEKQWMAWEDAHGLPKECVPTKQVEKGPHGEEVITYYADCSMDMANPPTEDKAKEDGAVLKGKRGTSTSPQQELFHKANRVVPAFSVDKKANARQALLKKAAKSADLVPPPLPPLLAVQKPKAKNAASPKLSPPKMSAKDKEAEAMLKSNLPQTPAQKRQTELFDQKVKAEEAKLVARDAARAQALIVDPDTSHTYLDVCDAIRMSQFPCMRAIIPPALCLFDIAKLLSLPR